ncbi:MAG: hypothetical protein VR69_14125 [Peptococcaceae bacterium BRH_c4b]|nr:MAG: hypothetical protein VR69_14125 [Peptococcaceae bacterium BRH_c4b]
MLKSFTKAINRRTVPRSRLNDLLSMPLLYRTALVLLTAFLFNGVLLSAASAANTERIKARDTLDSLVRDEKTLAEEILLVDLKIRRADDRLSKLQREIATTRALRQDSQNKFATAVEKKKASQDRLAFWLKFQYVRGNGTLLDLIFRSSTFTEFINRTHLVAIIMGQEFRAYTETSQYAALAAEHEKILHQNELELSAKMMALDKQISEIQNFRNSRERIWNGIKERSAGLTRKIYEMEKSWYQSINLLSLLADNLITMSRQTIPPDRYYFSPGGLVAEYKQITLNQAISKSDDPRVRNITVRLEPDIIIFTGYDRTDQSGFQISGHVTASAETGGIYFVPESLLLDGVPVSGKILEEIAPGKLVSLGELPATGFFNLSKVIISNGLLKIILN